MVESIKPEPTKQPELQPPEEPKKKRVSFAAVVKFAVGAVVTKVLQSWGKDIKAQAAEGKKSSQKSAEKNTQIKKEELQNERLKKETKRTKV